MPPSRDAQPARKRIALIAHDDRKGDLLTWVKFNRNSLAWRQVIGIANHTHELLPAQSVAQSSA